MPADDPEPAKVVEQVLEPEVGEGLPEVDASEDPIPPVPDADEDVAAGIFGDFSEDENEEGASFLQEERSVKSSIRRVYS